MHTHPLCVVRLCVSISYTRTATGYRVRGSLTDLVFQLGGLDLNTFVLFMGKGSVPLVCVACVSRDKTKKSAWKALLTCAAINKWWVRAKAVAGLCRFFWEFAITPRASTF